MTSFEKYTLAIQAVSALFVAATLFYAALQLKSVYKINSQGHDWNRRKAAQDFCTRYEELNPNKTKLLERLNYFQNDGVITKQEIQLLFEEQPELRLDTHQLLNYFEYLCVGIKQGIYDENVVKQFWSTVMLTIFSMLKPYIRETQVSSPAVWTLLEEYSMKWEHEKRLSGERGQVDL